MGLELIVGVALAAASAVGGLVTANAQSKAAKQAAAAQKEASEIETAGQRVTNRENRRQAIREERIRRATILQGAENTGAGGSSGAAGATGALSTSLGRAVGYQKTGERGAIGIGRANQNLVDARLSGQLAQARGNAFQSVLGGISNIFGAFVDAGAFQPKAPAK